MVVSRISTASAAEASTSGNDRRTPKQTPYIMETLLGVFNSLKREMMLYCTRTVCLNLHFIKNLPVMSPFEIVMLVCFGAAWPFSIYHSWKTRSNRGKSLFFLIIILVGYVAGALHKFLDDYDPVVYLYLANMVMVSTDILLFISNRRSKEYCVNINSRDAAL